jgi:hypothetical protein
MVIDVGVLVAVGDECQVGRLNLAIDWEASLGKSN